MGRRSSNRQTPATGKRYSRPEVGRIETEVVRLVAAGRTNAEIAGLLDVSEKTVEGRLARLFTRFDVASRTELATRALVEGWLDVPGA